jgi:hypothetical protein
VNFSLQKALEIVKALPLYGFYQTGTKIAENNEDI